MDTEINMEEWKTGTEAIGFCMICGAEYEPTRRECPDCHVSLSVVRRCPKCHRIVSAQHNRCVYCRTSFTCEMPEKAPADEALTVEGARIGKEEKHLRALAVGVVTFVLMFCLGLVFVRQVHRMDTPVYLIARSYVLRPIGLRQAPGLGSTVIDNVQAGTKVNLTGYRNSDQGQGWIALDWNHETAYVPAGELAAPKALDTGEGANVLKFYLAGMTAAEDVNDAVQAVDYYARAFPGDVHGEELRWILAERIRYLSQRGGPEEAALRRQAMEQYAQLEASKGSFAGKAQAATKFSSAAELAAAARRSGHKTEGLQVVGGSGTKTSTAKSAAHEVLVLNRAEVIVRAGALSQWTVGTVVSGRVAHPVKTNGIVAIPAGARCQLTVVSGDSSQASVSLGLTSIEVDHRAYAVKSLAVQTASGKGEDHALVFHLDAPLVIER